MTERTPAVVAPVLVVAALREEVAHLDADLEVLLTGVGKAQAAATLGARLATGPRPGSVLNVGTAGALDAGLGGVHDVDVVTQHDFPYDAIEALVDAPGAGLVRAYALDRSAAPRPVADVAGRCVLATGDTFVADADRARTLSRRGLHLVDMEAYGLAATCAAFGLPMRCVKAVSDQADAAAADSWLDLIDSCARQLAEWVRANARDAG